MKTHFITRIGIAFVFTWMLSTNAHTQIIGSLERGKPHPMTVKPESEFSQISNGSVDLHTGAYNHSIDLGTIQTPSGTKFNLSLQHGSTGVTTPFMTSESSIPYGDGWNLSVPQISYNLENVRQFYLSTAATSGDCPGELNQAGTREISGMRINIPGIYSGGLAFKAIEYIGTVKFLVLVPVHFSKYFEVRFDCQHDIINPEAHVYLGDGTVYEMRTTVSNYINPVNQLITPRSSVASSVPQMNPEDSYEPATAYHTSYVSEIKNKNTPFGETIKFQWKFIDGVNYHAELDNYRSKSNHEDLSEIILENITSYDALSVPYQMLKLNYQVDPSYKNSLGTQGIRLLNDFYVARTVWAAGLDGSAPNLNHISNSSNFFDFKNKWYEVNHGAIAPDNYNYWSDQQVNWQATNPYVCDRGGSQVQYIQHTKMNSKGVRMDHSYLECPNIPSSIFKKGCRYEIRSRLYHDNSYDDKYSTVDIDLSYTNNGDYHNRIHQRDNRLVTNYTLNSIHDGTLFSTFDRPNKWFTIGGSPHYAEFGSLDLNKSISRNYFIFPFERKIGPNESVDWFPNFYLRIGPGNSDHVYDVPADMGSKYPIQLTNQTATPGHYVRKSYQTAAYSMVYSNGLTSAYSSFPYAPNDCYTSCRPCMYPSVPHNFGVGQPWTMASTTIGPVSAPNGNDPNLFGHIHDSRLPNVPTRAFNSSIGRVEINLIEKMPTMLTSVVLYDFNSAYDLNTPTPSHLNLVFHQRNYRATLAKGLLAGMLNVDSNIVKKTEFTYGTIQLFNQVYSNPNLASYHISRQILTSAKTADLQNNKNLEETFEYSQISSNNNAFLNYPHRGTKNKNNTILCISKITNSLGKITSIAYNPSTLFVTRGEDALQITATVSSITEKAALASNSPERITNYLYSNLQKKYHYQTADERYGYQAVTVLHPINPLTFQRKKTVYHYFNCSSCVTDHSHNPQHEINASLFGKVIKVEEYNENNQLISTVENEYESKLAYKNLFYRSQDLNNECAYTDNGLAISGNMGGYQVKMNYYRNKSQVVRNNQYADMYFVKLKRKKTANLLERPNGSLGWNRSQEDYEYYEADLTGLSNCEGYRIMQAELTSQNGKYSMNPSWNLYKTTQSFPDNPNYKVTTEHFYFHDYLSIIAHANCQGGTSSSFYPQEDPLRVCNIYEGITRYHLRDLPFEKRTSYITIGFDTVRKSEYYGYEEHAVSYGLNSTLQNYPVNQDATGTTTDLPIKCEDLPQEDPNDALINSEKDNLYRAGCRILTPNIMLANMWKQPTNQPFRYTGTQAIHFPPCEQYWYNKIIQSWVVCPCNTFVNWLGRTLGGTINVNKPVGTVGTMAGLAPPYNGSSDQERAYYFINKNSYIYDSRNGDNREEILLGNYKIAPGSFDIGDIDHLIASDNQDIPFVIEDKIEHKLFVFNPDVFEDPVRLAMAIPGRPLNDEEVATVQANYQAIRGNYDEKYIYNLRTWLQEASEEEFNATFNGNHVGNGDDDPPIPPGRCDVSSVFIYLPSKITEKIDDIVIDNKNMVSHFQHKAILGSTENRNHINRPRSDGAIDAPFRTIAPRTILSRTPTMLIDKEVDAKGLVTKYYYDRSQWRMVCNSKTCALPNGMSQVQQHCQWALHYRSRHLPYRITQGFERHDSIGTNLFYNNDATLSMTLNDQGTKNEFFYDGFKRLRSTKKNGQLMARYNYRLWDRQTKNNLDDITNQNYIESITRFDPNSSRAVIRRAFIDPFGRKLGNMTASVANIAAIPNSFADAVMTGYQELDYDDKVLKSYKPFAVSGPLQVYRNTSYTNAPLEHQSYQYNFRNELVRTYDYDIPTTSTHYSESKTTLISGTELSTELNLNPIEIAHLKINNSYQYLRSETRDPDDKRVIVFSYLNGKKIADRIPMGSAPSITTIYAYDYKWDLKKIIDPKKNETDYKTNLQGLVYLKETPDQGFSRYYYDEVGQLVAMQDHNLFTENVSRVRLWTYDHFGRNLMQLLGTYDPSKLTATATDEPNPDCNTGYDNSTDNGGSPNGSDMRLPPVQYYRMPPLERLRHLYTFSADFDHPNLPTSYLLNSYGQSYYWLPNQNLTDPIDQIEPPKSIFDCLKQIKIEKHFAYNDLDRKYVETNERKPNQNDLYLQKLDEIKNTIGVSTVNLVQTDRLRSLGKLSTATSYDYIGQYNEITTTLYNAQEYPEKSIKHARFLSLPMKRYTIDYLDHNLGGEPSYTKLSETPMGGGQAPIYSQKMLYDDYGTVHKIQYASGTNQTLQDLAEYSYHRPSGKLISTLLSGISTSVTQSYDKRERLTQISSPFFTENLYYDANFPPAATTTAANNYNGNINGVQTVMMQCVPKDFSTPLAFVYDYDEANRLRGATTAATITVNNTTSAPFGSQSYTYDLSGNLSRYQSTELLPSTITSAAIKDYFYQYLSGTNKLESITPIANGTVPVTGQTANNRNFVYDWNGNVKEDGFRTMKMNYGRANLPYASNNLSTSVITKYGYDVADARIFKGDGTQEARYYLGGIGNVNLITGEWELYPGGLMQIRNQKHSYVLRDHLTNTRALIGQTDACGLGVFSAYDYYPYGKILRKFESLVSRYKSTNHEKDIETGYDDRHARWYDDESLNFLQCDPMSDKYPSHSPYHYVLRNPIRMIDPTGKYSKSVHLDDKGNIIKKYDDGDKGVYLHKNMTSESELNKSYSSKNTSAGGDKIGELGGTIDANYIYSNTLNENISESKSVWSPITFRNLVKNRGEWDLKSNKNTIYGLANDGKTTFLFEGNKMESQDIGNHHFGAVGKAYGFFTEEFMLKQAGAAQMKAGTSRPEWQKYKNVIIEDTYIESDTKFKTTEKIMLPPYGDDPRDQKWIKSGFQYYNKTTK